MASKCSADMATFVNGARNNWYVMCASRRSMKAPTVSRRWIWAQDRRQPGAYYRQFADEIRQFIAGASSDLNEFTQPLAAALDTLDQLTAWVLDRSQNNPNEIGAAC